MKFDVDTINEQIQKLGKQISENYLNKNLVVIFILPNAVMFTADLLRCIDVDNLQVENVYVKQKEGQLIFTALNSLAYVKDKCVLIVECITETGVTLNLVQERLLQFNPSSVQSVVLFFKTGKFKGMRPAYIGFEIEDDRFLYGYGMSKKDGSERNQPFVTSLPLKMI